MSKMSEMNTPTFTLLGEKYGSLDREHTELIKSLDHFIHLLISHDINETKEAEKIRKSFSHHHHLHEVFINRVKSLRQDLIQHINTADTAAFPPGKEHQSQQYDNKCNAYGYHIQLLTAHPGGPLPNKCIEEELRNFHNIHSLSQLQEYAKIHKLSLRLIPIL